MTEAFFWATAGKSHQLGSFSKQAASRSLRAKSNPHGAITNTSGANATISSHAT
jgi:hypothetical protein